jgi:hypothetical protein
MPDTPNPGSERAISAGCTCPVIDNHYGRGVPYPDGPAFWKSEDCPLHGTDTVDVIADAMKPSEASSSHMDEVIAGAFKADTAPGVEPGPETLAGGTDGEHDLGADRPADS